MEPKMLEWIMSQGIGAVLALVMFLVYRKDVRNGLSQWKDQTTILVTLTKESTATNQELVNAVEALTAQLPFACPMRERLAAKAEPAKSAGARPRGPRE